MTEDNTEKKPTPSGAEDATPTEEAPAAETAQAAETAPATETVPAPETAPAAETAPADKAESAPEGATTSDAAPAAADGDGAAATTETEAAEPEEEVDPGPPPFPTDKVKNGYIWGTGRRKSSVARVRIRPGTGLFQINGRKLEEYFCTERLIGTATAALRNTNRLQHFDIFVNASGGGITGQAGAVLLGTARALRIADPRLDATLREQGLLTRDSRQKERKKYGRRGARRSFQFSKR